MLEPWTIWVLLLILLMLGVPIWVSLGFSTFIFLYFNDIPLSIIPGDLSKIGDMFTLLAIPAFIFAGALMEKGGIADKIVDVARIFVGRIHGGLALVTILGCIFFAAMIGSGPGTVAAMGALMLPAMLKEGYDKKFSAGVTATGGTLGILIPPSNPMIIYGVMANVSVATMFMAGFIPGIVGGGILMLTAYTISKKRGYKPDPKIIPASEAVRTIVKNLPSLLTPVIILGGIYSGSFTPIEASAVAVFYALFVGFFINKELSFQGIYEALKITNITSGTSMIIVGVSILFGRFLTLYEVPQTVTLFFLSVSQDPIIILLLIALLLFILGMFMETLSTIVILVPILMPVVNALGIDPVHFGIMWIVTNQVALLTPPLGANLFIAMTLSNLSLEECAKGAFPFIIALLIFTLMVIFIPDISLILPKILTGYGG